MYTVCVYWTKFHPSFDTVSTKMKCYDQKNHYMLTFLCTCNNVMVFAVLHFLNVFNIMLVMLINREWYIP